MTTTVFRGMINIESEVRSVERRRRKNKKAFQTPYGSRKALDQIDFHCWLVENSDRHYYIEMGVFPLSDLIISQVFQ